MFFIEEKLKARIRELAALRYVQRHPLEGWWMREDEIKSEKYPPDLDASWQAMKMGTVWRGRDKYLWLRTAFYVPVSRRPQLLLFDLGTTGGGANSGFESLLFIDEKPYQGVDSNHKEVFIDKIYYGKTINLALKLWSGLEGGGVPRALAHEFRYADAAALAPEVDDLYYTAKNMLKTAQLLTGSQPERVLLLNALDRAFQVIDWSQPGSAHFYASCRGARDLLKEALGKTEKHSPVTVTAVGHTHIDVAWLWRLKHTREKAARSFSTVLRLMDQYPEYVFLQTQPQLYQYIKEDYPELFRKIKKRAGEGRWEIDGAMWLEADCNLPSGESLVRQILHGSRFIRKEFQKDVHYLWLPDVFGYSWALPQILKKSGIQTFMTTKISWNEQNRMPHDTFIWRGIDGSEVLTHFISTPNPEDIGTDSWWYTYNGELEPSTVWGIYDRYQDKDINPDLLLSFGYGDGGGGPTRDMIENRRRMAEIPGLPHVRTGKADDYFQRLHERLQTTDRYVHTWDGELYLEYHRGTYTSQANVKKMNRKLELLCRKLEIMEALALRAVPGWDYPAEKLHAAWTIILRNQFHDILPGSAIHEVYEDCKKDYGQALKALQEMKQEVSAHLFDEGPQTYAVFNSAGWMRDALVSVPLQEDGTFVDENGTALKSVRSGDGYLVRVPDIPALGMKPVRFSAGPLSRGEKKVDKHPDGLDTPFYRLKWNSSGQLTELYDKTNRRSVLADNQRGNMLQLFEDKPLRFDAWNIDIFFNEKKKELHAKSVDVIASNALFTVVRFVYEFGRSRIVQDMVVYETNRRIDFKTHVDWHERQQLLKAAFEVDVRATEATYQIQFGNVKRPTHWNTSWDMAKFESVAHQWVDFSERDYGVSLLNDCKYGHAVKDHTLTLSLLKGGIRPDPEADVGTHDFTYSLLPHRGDYVAGNVEQEAWNLNDPITAIPGRIHLNRTPLFEMPVDQPLAIDAIKKQEDGNGLVLRFHDHTGSRRTIRLIPAFAFQEWLEVDLMEKAVSKAVASDDCDDVTVILKPYEIKTLLFR